MSDFGQTMRIVQAKLPVIEIEIGSFCPVLHLSPIYLRPPQAEAAEQSLSALRLFSNTLGNHKACLACSYLCSVHGKASFILQ